MVSVTVISSLVTILSFSVVGLHWSLSLQRRVQLCREIERAVCQLRVEMMEQKQPLARAFARVTERSGLSLFATEGFRQEEWQRHLATCYSGPPALRRQLMQLCAVWHEQEQSLQQREFQGWLEQWQQLSAVERERWLRYRWKGQWLWTLIGVFVVVVLY